MGLVEVDGPQALVVQPERDYSGQLKLKPHTHLSLAWQVECGFLEVKRCKPLAPFVLAPPSLSLDHAGAAARAVSGVAARASLGPHSWTPFAASAGVVAEPQVESAGVGSLGYWETDFECCQSYCFADCLGLAWVGLHPFRSSHTQVAY